MWAPDEEGGRWRLGEWSVGRPGRFSERARRLRRRRRERAADRRAVERGRRECGRNGCALVEVRPFRGKFLDAAGNLRPMPNGWMGVEMRSLCSKDVGSKQRIVWRSR